MAEQPKRTVNRNRLLLYCAFALFVVYIVGIFLGWTGNVDASLPWIAFAAWVLASLV